MTTTATVKFHEVKDGQRFRSVDGDAKGKGVFVRDASAGEGKVCPNNYARREKDGDVWFFGDPCVVAIVN